MEIKGAAAVLDWPIEWDLAPNEDISSSTWLVSPSEPGGLEVVPGSEAVTGFVTSCLVQGGIFRRVYVLTNRVATNQGRTLEQTVTVRIGNSEVTQ